MIWAYYGYTSEEVFHSSMCVRQRGFFFFFKEEFSSCSHSGRI